MDTWAYVSETPVCLSGSVISLNLQCKDTVTIMRLLYTLLLIASVAVRLMAAEPYMFRKLDITNGLSNYDVKTILKDSEGYLWVGTAAGLNKYDGNRFKQYVLNMPQGGNGDFVDDIWSLKEDAAGNIWVRGGDGTFAIYNREKDDFSVDVGSVLAAYGISVHADDGYDVYIDSGRNIWVMSGSTIYYCDPSTGWMREKDLGRDLHGECLDISDNASCLFILLDSGGVVTVDKTDLGVGDVRLPDTNEVFNHIYIDCLQGVWLFSDYENTLLHSQRPGEWTTLTLPSKNLIHHNGIRCMLDDRDGHVWIGTDHNGVYMFDQVKGGITALRQSGTSSNPMQSDNVSCIYMDSSGTIWLGHNKAGISYHNDMFRQFEDSGIIDSGDITALLEDSDGNLWIGMEGYGLYRSGAGGGDAVKVSSVPECSIICLREDMHGRIWVGGYGAGLYCIDDRHTEHYTTRNSGLASDIVWDIVDDKYGNIWISTMSDTQRLDVQRGEFRSVMKPDGYPVNSMSLHYDPDDNVIYVGSFYGFFKIDVVTGRHEHLYSNARGTRRIKQGIVAVIYRDRRGNMWLGHNQGLSVLNEKTDSMYYIDKKDGLCDNMIRSITEDDTGRMWISTSNGLSVLSVRWGSNGEFGYNVRNYTRKDGLKSSFFNHKAVAARRNGRMLFGTSDGCVSFYPEKMFGTYHPDFKVKFTDLYIETQHIEVDSVYKGRVILDRAMDRTQRLDLDHDNYLVTLNFTVCNLTGFPGVRYSYLLEGLNDRWLYTDDNSITFASLPPGRYRLLVKACNPDGVWSADASTLEINVRPPFYRSGLAYTGYVILLLGAGSLAMHEFRRRNRRKFTMQKKRLEDEQMVRMNEMKLRFFTNISHDLRTPLTLIMVPLQVMMDEVKDEKIRARLKTMHSNALHLLEMINTLLDFRKLDVGAESLHCRPGDFSMYVRELCTPFADYAVSRGIRFSVECQPSSLWMDFDAGKVKRIIGNLLSNAFKYTPDGGEISVSAVRTGDKVTVSVADNGEGIDDETKKHIFERFYQGEQAEYNAGNGIGLHIANEYVRMHGGSISVEDNHPRGSVFVFTLPLGYAGAACAEEPEVEAADTVGEVCLPEESAEHGTRTGILVVDDNREFCSIMSDILSDDYNVFKAHDGEEAIRVLESEDIRLVVSDVMMPVMDGMELCRHIKSNICWSHIPVILLTARTAEEYHMEGLETGADDYITKPFSFPLLKLRIRKFIELFNRNHDMFRNKVEIEPSEITITSLDEKLVEKAIAIVEEHMDDPELSVEMLSRELALSRGYLYKKLMAITGKGPAEFIRTVRLKRAYQMLAKSQLQIAEIAYKCGFNSPRRFAQNFKNEFGMLPSEFLKSHNVS